MTDELFPVENELGDQVKEVLRALTVEIVQIEEKAGSLKSQLGQLNEAKKNKTQEVVRILTDAGMKSLKWDDGLMVMRKTNKYPRVAKEFWPKFKRWLQRNKYWGLATIHNKTLVSLLKERIERGQKIPKYVQVYEEDSLAVRGKSAVRKESADGSEEM